MSKAIFSSPSKESSSKESRFFSVIAGYAKTKNRPSKPRYIGARFLRKAAKLFGSCGFFDSEFFLTNVCLEILMIKSLSDFLVELKNDVRVFSNHLQFL